jgi:hypothetical protein
MLRSATINRRTMLWLMSSALAAMAVSLALPVKSMAEGLGCLPGSLSLLPLHNNLFRQARRRMQTHPGDRRIYQAAQTYLYAPDNPVSLDRFEHQVRQDFVAGRIAVVDGWVVAETEVALLALVKRSL